MGQEGPSFDLSESNLHRSSLEGFLPPYPQLQHSMPCSEVWLPGAAALEMGRDRDQRTLLGANPAPLAPDYTRLLSQLH